MIKKRGCALCNDIIPNHLGVLLGGKLYCCQRHAEEGFIGITYNELNLIVKSDGRNNGPGKKTSDEEILYAAILRNAGMTGQELTEQFRKVFPDRTRLSIIKNIIIKARRADLCR